MSEHLSDEQLAVLREELLRQRAELLARGGVQAEDASTEPLDLHELATRETEAHDRLRLSDRDRARLGEVLDALGRVAGGVYGLCEDSGEPIPFARLRAQPTVRLTVEAQQWAEAQAAQSVRTSHDVDDSAY